SQREENHYHRQYSARPPARAFFTRAGDKRQREKNPDDNDRRGENEKGFHIIRQQREDRESQEKKEIRSRHRVDVARVRHTGGALGPEVSRAAENAENDEAAENQILADRLGIKRHSLFFEQSFVLAGVGFLIHYFARRWILVDA